MSKVPELGAVVYADALVLTPELCIGHLLACITSARSVPLMAALSALESLVSSPNPSLLPLIEALMELISMRNMDIHVLLRAARICALWSSATSSSTLHVLSRKLLSAFTHQERLRGLVSACALLPTLPDSEALDLLLRAKRAAVRHPEFLGLLYELLAELIQSKKLTSTFVKSVEAFVILCEAQCSPYLMAVEKLNLT